MNTELKDARKARVEEVEGALASVEVLVALTREAGRDASIFDASIALHKRTLADLESPGLDMVKRYGRPDHLVGLGTLAERGEQACANARGAVRRWRGAAKAAAKAAAEPARAEAAAKAATEAALALAIARSLSPKAADERRHEAHVMLEHHAGDPTPEGAELFERWRAELEAAPTDVKRRGLDGNGVGVTVAVVAELADWSADQIKRATFRRM